MTGTPIKTQITFIPPPTDGLNLVDPPPLLKQTEARQLDNYLIYDWGIRERGPATKVATAGLPDGGTVTGMFGFGSASVSGILVCSSTGRTYRYVNGGFTALSAVVSPWYQAFSYGGYIFQPLASGAVARYKLADDTWTGATFTPAAASIWGFAYRNRCYFINTGSAVVEFGAVQAITGAMTGTYDFSQFFQRGRILLWGTSWAYNQGLSNEELLVVGNDQGEVLIYSGGFPASSDWDLVARVDIPPPVGGVFGGSQVIPTVVKVGQDIIIVTSRGAVSLRSVVEGKAESAAYYNLSRQIGAALSGGGGDRAGYNPFLYFAAQQDVYVQNYERGAWSRFPGIASGSNKITCIACNRKIASVASYHSPTGPVQKSYALVSVDNGDVYQIIEEDTTGFAADSSATYVWASPFNDLGTPLQKQTKLLRVFARDMAQTSISNSVSCAVDFKTTTLGASTATTTASGLTYAAQEVRPPGAGSYISFVFSKTGSSSAMNEISGANLFYETGGVY